MHHPPGTQVHADMGDHVWSLAADAEEHEISRRQSVRTNPSGSIELLLRGARYWSCVGSVDT